MNKLVIAAMAACVAAVAAPALADPIAIPIVGGPDFGTGTFGATHGTGGFDDSYTFVIPDGDFTVGNVTASFDLGNTSLTKVLLDGVSLDITLGSNGSYMATGSVSSITNPQTLEVIGSVAGSVGSYAGTVSYAAGAVPEPASWALMISGFGLTGAALRRRTVRLANA